MKNHHLILFLFLLISQLISCVATHDPVKKRARLLQRGKITEDTSFVYALPYDSSVSPLIVQGYYGSFTHRNRAALDFKMKQGTKVLAARGGIVARMENRNNKGGAGKKYRKYANYVVIQHADGSRAGYWHLRQHSVFVKVGDTILQGQLLGLSGKTGNAAIAHLHFLAWNYNDGKWQPLPTRFQTAKGVKYLRPWRRYRSLFR